MNRQQVYQWLDEATRGMAGVTRFQRENIGHFSPGVIYSQSCHERKIARRVRGRANSQRRRLQRFLSSGVKLKAYFAAWSRWVVSQVEDKVLRLVVDETKLGERMGVMLVGLAYEGRCIPLAWRAYRANERAAYPAEGQSRLIIRLLKAIQAGIGSTRRVCVLADRGIGTSALLMKGIMAMGWTFLFRVTKQSKIILADGREVTFYDQVRQPGQTFAASGLVFKQRGHVPAHVRVLWAPQAREPWALVTNDPTLTGWEYAQRAWVEPTFRDLKSHGWRWGQSALTQPSRVERLLILLSLAYTAMLFLGLRLEQAGQTFPKRRRPDGSRVRRWSLFQEGLAAFSAACCPACSWPFV